MDKKPKSTFSKITKIVIWIMLIATIGGILLSSLAAIGVI